MQSPSEKVFQPPTKHRRVFFSERLGQAAGHDEMPLAGATGTVGGVATLERSVILTIHQDSKEAS